MIDTPAAAVLLPLTRGLMALIDDPLRAQSNNTKVSARLIIWPLVR